MAWEWLPITRAKICTRKVQQISAKRSESASNNMSARYAQTQRFFLSENMVEGIPSLRLKTGSSLMQGKLMHCYSSLLKSGIYETFPTILHTRYIYIQDFKCNLKGAPGYGNALLDQAHDLHVSSADNLTERQGLSWFLWRYKWLLPFLIYSLISKSGASSYMHVPIFSTTVETTNRKQEPKKKKINDKFILSTQSASSF
jgi:hypothetical protein